MLGIHGKICWFWSQKHCIFKKLLSVMSLRKINTCKWLSNFETKYLKTPKSFNLKWEYTRFLTLVYQSKKAMQWQCYPHRSKEQQMRCLIPQWIRIIRFKLAKLKLKKKMGELVVSLPRNLFESINGLVELVYHLAIWTEILHLAWIPKWNVHINLFKKGSIQKGIIDIQLGQTPFLRSI